MIFKVYTTHKKADTQTGYLLSDRRETPVLPDAKLGFLDGLEPPCIEKGGLLFFFLRATCTKT